MRIGSLFSGIGALDLTVEEMGFGEIVWHCENDPEACRVLEEYWPRVPNLGDISKVNWLANVPSVDVIVGGFPCVDISNAGLRAGIEGAESGLWVHMATAIRVLRPQLVIVENVAALLLRGLDRVLGDLAEERYDARWTCLRASDIGAPHQRERLFLVAVDTDRSIGFRRPAESQAREARFAAGPAQAHDWGDFAPAVHHWERIMGRVAPPPAQTRVNGTQRINPRLTEWMMGLPDGWVTSLGLSHAGECRTLGNAVVPQQAKAAIALLMDHG